MSRLPLRAFGLGVIVAVCSAHVGSPDVYYEGSAGPYHVLVVVRMPGVVPGVAQIAVRVTGGGEGAGAGAPPERVSVGVNHFDAATAPPLEDAVRDRTDPASFASRLWVMSSGSNAVTVRVVGGAGSGSAVVPVVAVATRRLPLYRWLGVVLAIIGVVLFAGAVSIVGAAVRESTLAPGAVPDARTLATARIAMATTAVATAGLLYFGRQWWTAEDNAFQRGMYRPMAARSEVRGGGRDGVRELAFVIVDSDWTHRGDTAWLREQEGSAWSPLIPDHGKLIHLFLVGEAQGSAFAHLHPTTSDSVTFVSVLPPVPAGRYRVFADIVHESGFDQTLVASVELPAPVALTRSPRALGDSDDAWSVGEPAPLGGGRGDGGLVRLPDGSTLRWVPPSGGSKPVVAGSDAELRFVVQAADGRTARLDPYMGMAGHAVVVRDDGSTFIHLHPMGTVSAASQMAYMVRTAADTAMGAVARRLTSAGMSGGGMVQPAGDTLSFPYAFPRPGRYRVWVQFKRAGRILTAPLVVEVGAGVGCQPPGVSCQPTANGGTRKAADGAELATMGGANGSAPSGTGRWHRTYEAPGGRARASASRPR